MTAVNRGLPFASLQWYSSARPSSPARQTSARLDGDSCTQFGSDLAEATLSAQNWSNLQKLPHVKRSKWRHQASDVQANQVSCTHTPAASTGRTSWSSESRLTGHGIKACLRAATSSSIMSMLDAGSRSSMAAFCCCRRSSSCLKVARVTWPSTKLRSAPAGKDIVLTQAVLPTKPSKLGSAAADGGAAGSATAPGRYTGCLLCQGSVVMLQLFVRVIAADRQCHPPWTLLRATPLSRATGSVFAAHASMCMRLQLTCHCLGGHGTCCFVGWCQAGQVQGTIIPRHLAVWLVCSALLCCADQRNLQCRLGSMDLPAQPTTAGVRGFS